MCMEPWTTTKYNQAELKSLRGTLEVDNQHHVHKAEKNMSVVDLVLFDLQGACVRTTQ
jgi:hypothetical protein